MKKRAIKKFLLWLGYKMKLSDVQVVLIISFFTCIAASLIFTEMGIYKAAFAAVGGIVVSVIGLYSTCLPEPDDMP